MPSTASVSTRARRKSPTERSAEILDAARVLALRDGLVAVTQRAVAAEVGVAPALVAHYQPGMDALVARTFATISAAELAEVVALLGRDGPVGARLRRLTETLLDGGRADVTAVWVDAWSLGRRNEPLAVAVRAESAAWHAVVADLVTAGLETGELGSGDPDNVGWQFLGLVDGLNAQALIHFRDPGAQVSLVLDVLARELGLDPTSFRQAMT